MTADMRRVYGLDIRLIWVGRLTVLDCADLLMGLPNGSLIWQALDSPRAWTLDQHLLAALVDRMNTWMWANSDPKKRGPRPEPLPRPGTQLEDNEQKSSERTTRTIKPVGMSITELDRFMSQRFEDTQAQENRPALPAE